MKFYTINQEERTVEQVVEPTTVREASRAVYIAIARWLLSEQDCPDSQATDGVSEVEGAMEL